MLFSENGRRQKERIHKKKLWKESIEKPGSTHWKAQYQNTMCYWELHILLSEYYPTYYPDSLLK